MSVDRLIKGRANAIQEQAQKNPQATPELVAGSYAPVASATSDLLAYRREYEGDVLLIVLNLVADPISIGSETTAFPGEILLSTNLDRAGVVSVPSEGFDKEMTAVRELIVANNCRK